MTSDQYERQLGKLQDALVEGRIDRATYERMKQDMQSAALPADRPPTAGSPQQPGSWDWDGESTGQAIGKGLHTGCASIFMVCVVLIPLTMWLPWLKYIGVPFLVIACVVCVFAAFVRATQHCRRWNSADFAIRTIVVLLIVGLGALFSIVGYCNEDFSKASDPQRVVGKVRK